jgi:hypothetical protein
MEKALHSALDIGALKRLRILCISETGWFDTDTVFGDIRDAGGADTDQYSIPWPPFGPLHTENAAGFSALLEVETADGACAACCSTPAGIPTGSIGVLPRRVSIGCCRRARSTR